MACDFFKGPFRKILLDDSDDDLEIIGAMKKNYYYIVVQPNVEDILGTVTPLSIIRVNVSEGIINLRNY
jgi:hypothetical protein